MATKPRAERPDPARSLALLWGSHTRPGRSGLTLRAIIDAAIAIADRDGLDALSMRQVADALEVGTMSLYTHVPGKAELTDLMVDAVYGQLYASVDEPAQQGGWRAGLTLIATRNWDAYLKHPWLLHIVQARPVLGPNISLKYEAELRPLDGVGLGDVEIDSVLTLVLMHVEGTARVHTNALRARRDTGITDAEWWRATAPVLERVMAGREFPVAARVGSAAGQAHNAVSSPAHTFQFGLARILDGVALLIDQRTAPRSPRAAPPRSPRAAPPRPKRR